MTDKFKDIARDWLDKHGLLKAAWDPEPKDQQGFGSGVGEWEECEYNYKQNVAYNDRLVASLVGLET